MIGPDYIRSMAAYGAEMNKRMFAAAGRLNDASRRSDQGAFWGSLHGTLAHLLWGDMIWMSRFAGWPAPAVPQKESAALIEDFAELRHAREKFDAALLIWAETVQDAFLDSEQSWFSGAAQREMRAPRRALLLHMFNHQVHHRGQAHALLTRLGEDVGVTDIWGVLPFPTIKRPSPLGPGVRPQIAPDVRLRSNTALLIIDMQLGFDDERWGTRNNPDAERNAARLLAAWRQAAMPVLHIHHDSLSRDGAFHSGSPGNLPKPETAPLTGEPIFRKAVNSAFIGTGLEADLRRRGIGSLVIVGLTTNHCVSTTARTAGNLGFETSVVSDATATFPRVAGDARMRDANEVHQAALGDLAEEFATVARTDEILAALAGIGAEAPLSPS
jgi:nicotinamidase-related amidase/uncharacterized damage-inducible protein DinB